MMTNLESIEAGHRLRAEGGTTVQWLVLYRYDDGQLLARVLDVMRTRTEDDVRQLIQRQSPQALSVESVTSVPKVHEALRQDMGWGA